MSSERFQKLAIKATQRGLIKSTPISTKDGNLATDPQSQFINNNCLKILNAMITPFKFGTTRAVVPIYSCTNLFSVIWRATVCIVECHQFLTENRHFQKWFKNTKRHQSALKLGTKREVGPLYTTKKIHQKVSQRLAPWMAVWKRRQSGVRQCGTDSYFPIFNHFSTIVKRLRQVWNSTHWQR